MNLRTLLLLALALPAAAQDLHFAADRVLDLVHLRLDAKVDLQAKELQGHATLDLRALRPTRVIRLDAPGLAIGSAKLAREGEPESDCEATHDGRTLELVVARPLSLGESVRVTVDYVCHDPEAGLYFFAPTAAQPDVPFQAWSQGETEENRYWIPLLDRPNERLTSELVVTAQEGLEVLSNGTLAERHANGDGTETWHYRQDKDHAPYLITLVVGDFDIVREDWDGRPVEYWVPPGRAEDAKRSFGNTPRMLDFFSAAFGPYPWDKYAQVVVEQFKHGGMENTGATTLTERTLHDERAHLDYTSDGLVAHELAHQWFGDFVTCTDWANVWLNEGFASYAEALWDEHHLGRDAFECEMWGKREGAFNAGRDKPIVYRAYRNEWEQFDGRAYPKGAWVVHMLRRRLGEEQFWAALRHYLAQNALRCVDTTDLRRSFENATGASLGRFFYDWTERAGHPVVEVRHKWDAERHLAEMHAKQTQKGDAFHVPLTVEYRCGDAMHRATFDLDAKEAHFFTTLPARPDMIRVDPEFAVLMELKEDKGRDLWLRQLTTDPSAAARIRAAEHLGQTRRDDDRRALGEALRKEAFWGVQREIARVLGESGGDPSRDALLGAVALADPRARRAVVGALGKFRDDAAVLAALARLVADGDPSYYVEAEAIRSYAGLRPDDGVARLVPLLDRDSHNEVIREAVLEGLGASGDPAATDVILAWTANGKPRECRTAALQGIAQLAGGVVWDGAQTARVVEAVDACLAKGEPDRVKARAAETLRALGEQATPALSALEALAEHDASENVRREAKSAIEKIRSGAPPHVELQRLRGELQKVRDENRALKERLDRIDGKAQVPSGG